MTEQQRKPLVLVVDDVPEFRDVELPWVVEQMGCRVCKAASVGEALNEAQKHAPDTEDPLNLVILDMHMRIGDGSGPNVTDGGIRLWQEYQFVKCPIVACTAYPSYADCVAATRAGVSDYIPKKKQDNGEGGSKALQDACERLLKGVTDAVEAPPTEAWIGKNQRWLMTEFQGKWVAFIDKQAAKEAQVSGGEERDGLVLLAGDSYRDVRARLLAFPRVLVSFPAIFLVR